MFEAVEHEFLVPFDGSFKISEAATKPEEVLKKKKAKKLLNAQVEQLHELQRAFYASDKHSVLLVFQAMDAAGKDSTIRAVLSGINPAGCQVFSFKKPSDEELDHDFLWRTTKRLPERGRIGVFNRSYYEEVLVVRVHPGILDGQKLPHRPDALEQVWQERFESIQDFEKHMARNGTVIVKFWLNVSRDEQRNRFLDRIDNPDKNWKFSMADVRERGHWDSYMNAYEEAINATSRSYAPWYAIPADDKPFMRLTVAEILVKTFQKIDPQYPVLSHSNRAELKRAKTRLLKEG